MSGLAFLKGQWAKAHQQWRGWMNPKGFAAQWYYKQYPDVAVSGVNPYRHFVNHGAYEGRNPMPGFSFSGYLFQQQLSVEQGLRVWRQDSQIKPGVIKVAGDREVDTSALNLLCVGHQLGEQIQGAERSFLDVISALQSQPLNLWVLLPEAKNTDYVNALTRKVCGVAFLPYAWWQANRRCDEDTCAWLVSFIQQQDFQVIYVNTSVLYEPLVAAKSCQLPVITHVRELPQHDESLCSLMATTPEGLLNHISQLTDRFIANSKCVAQFLGDAKPVDVIPNMYDNALTQPIPLPGKSRLQVGIISSNIQKKGLQDFFDLALLAESEAVAADFLIYGPETELLTRLKKRADWPCCLYDKGYVDHVSQALVELDVVVNVSNFEESFGRTLLEAMCSGRIPVAYDFGALSELVQPEFGILVPQGDIKGLLRAVDSLCYDANKRDEMRAAASTFAYDHYSPEVISNTLYQLVKQTVAKSTVSEFSSCSTLD